MARVLQTKPRYRPRGTVSVYLLRGELVARAWRRPGPDPKTARQLAQRNRMACASAFLKHFATLVARGYSTGYKANGRKIGAYHVALARLVREHTMYSRGRWRIDYAGVQLAEGEPTPLRGLAAERKGGRLLLSWRGKAPARAVVLCVAIYDAARNRGYVLRVQLRAGTTTAQVPLPKGVGANALQVWALPADASLRLPWCSAHCVAPQQTTTTSTTSSAPTTTTQGVPTIEPRRQQFPSPPQPPSGPD